jgi:hypothetical protein
LLFIRGLQPGGRPCCLVGIRNRDIPATARHRFCQPTTVVRPPTPATKIKDWTISLAERRPSGQTVEEREINGWQGVTHGYGKVLGDVAVCHRIDPVAKSGDNGTQHLTAAMPSYSGVRNYYRW